MIVWYRRDKRTSQETKLWPRSWAQRGSGTTNKWKLLTARLGRPSTGKGSVYCLPLLGLCLVSFFLYAYSLLYRSNNRCISSITQGLPVILIPSCVPVWEEWALWFYRQCSFYDTGLSCRNSNAYASSSPGQRLIDLHGLHVGEAIPLLKREIAQLRYNVRNTRQRETVFICVGTGHHTKGSRTPSRLPAAVQRYLLEEEHLQFTEPQAGMLRIIIRWRVLCRIVYSRTWLDKEVLGPRHVTQARLGKYIEQLLQFVDESVGFPLGLLSDLFSPATGFSRAALT
jgi:hypothetical protein